MWPKKLFYYLFSFSITCGVIFIAPSGVGAQNQCLSKAEANKIIRSISISRRSKKNKKLRRELLKMQKVRLNINRKILSNPGKAKGLIEKSKRTGRKNLLRFCEILKEYGWLRKEMVSKEGLEAALFLIRNSDNTQIQREIFPVLVEANRKNYISKGILATLIDKSRIKSRGRQIFGTQIKIKNEVGYLYPLENEARVDKWRKIYDLPPISNFIKIVEIEYRTIVVKMRQPPKLLAGKQSNLTASQSEPILPLSMDEDEIINVESRLVNLNVRVLNSALLGTRGLNLKREDFVVFENGQEQKISFFSTTDTPFDLVLLLDLSGSTREKQYLIGESAKRFIELTRPSDRISIVTFTDRVKIISKFTSDKQKLLGKLEELNDFGGSRVWDALSFTYKKLLNTSQAGRRRAVVFMTDGVDNTLMLNYAGQNYGGFFRPRPSKITFMELLELARQNDTTVFPIYLDTEANYSGRTPYAKSYRQARRSLKMLSEESGGSFYRAAQLEDLSGIYEKIINDLSEVYSLGYEPINGERDGSWRELKVRVKGRPDLIIKSKNGYYAK